MAGTRPTPSEPAESKTEVVEVRTFGLVDRYEKDDIVVDRESGQVPKAEVDVFIREAGMRGVHVMELKEV
jgi:hypothetical protein